MMPRSATDPSIFPRRSRRTALAALVFGRRPFHLFFAVAFYLTAVGSLGCAGPSVAVEDELGSQGPKSDDDDDGGTDGSRDGSTDGSTDASTDAGTDARTDAGTDGAIDGPPIDAPPTPPGPVTIYLAMDGETLTCGLTMSSETNTISDAMCRYEGTHGAINGTGLCGFWVSFADCKRTIGDKVRSLFAPWAIEVVTERPATGNYLMIVVNGGDNKTDVNAETLNIRSPISCTGDVLQNSIGIVWANGTYWSALSEPACTYRTIDSLANNIGHVAGHLMGLFHNEDSGSVMYPIGPMCARTWACGTLRDTGSDGNLARCRSQPPADVACPTDHLNRVIGPR